MKVTVSISNEGLAHEFEATVRKLYGEGYTTEQIKVAIAKMLEDNIANLNRVMELRSKRNETV